MRTLLFSFILFSVSSLQPVQINSVTGSYTNYLNTLPKAAYFVAGAVTATAVDHSIRYINNNPGAQANLVGGLYGTGIAGIQVLTATVLQAINHSELIIPAWCVLAGIMTAWNLEQTSPFPSYTIDALIKRMASKDNPSAPVLETRTRHTQSSMGIGVVGVISGWTAIQLLPLLQ